MSNSEIRWEKLKRQIESYKQLTLTMERNDKHDTCIYFLQNMERLETHYPDMVEKL